jgi:hypothetical protein
MKFKDAILIPGIILPLIPAVLMGRVGYGGFYLGVWVMFYIAFGLLGELWSKKTRDKTISEDISDTPRWLFLMVVISWAMFPLCLIIHWWMGR